MLANLNGWHALIILAVIVMLFGATRIPALAKGFGRSIRIFSHEIRPEPPREANDHVSN